MRSPLPLLARLASLSHHYLSNYVSPTLSVRRSSLPGDVFSNDRLVDRHTLWFSLSLSRLTLLSTHAFLLAWSLGLRLSFIIPLYGPQSAVRRVG